MSNNTVQHEVGEVVIVFVNIIGWMVLAITLLTGLINVIMFVVPDAPEEVTIEQQAT